MKVAFFTYSSAFQNVGGGEIQLLKTKEYLEKAGVSIDLFDMWKSRIENYDVLHVFSSLPECLGLIQVAKAKKVKVVTSSVLWSDFRSHPLRSSLKWICPSFPSERRKVLNASDRILPNSEAEKMQITRFFAIPSGKIHVVHNAVDAVFADAEPSLFRAKYGPEPFILSVGRIEPRKNQLNLIRAVKKAGKHRLVLIGSPVSGHEDYYKKCLEEGANFTTFIQTVLHTDTILKSAYAACELFVLPARFETPGLAALEAALAGAKLLVTKGGSTKEYFKDHASYLDPSDVTRMAEKINEALVRPKDQALKDHVLNNYTWDRAARETIACYKEVLGRS